MFRRFGLVTWLIVWGATVYGQSRIDTISMPTLSALNNRPVLVYLPDGYDNTENDTIRYPILYLLHGVNGDEYSWSRNGNIQYILDSLISHRLIRPCVVVMPNTNAGKYIWGKRYKDLEGDRDVKIKGFTRNILGYFKNRKGNFIDYFNEIEDLAYARYRVSNHPQDRIVAGLSNGAYQAVTISNTHPGRYVWVGLLSPVIFKEQLPEADEDWCITNDLPDGTHFFISVGEADIFRSYGVRFGKLLRKRHIPYVLVSVKGSHNWKTWRNDFCTFIRYAFPYEGSINSKENQLYLQENEP
jgi:enterochelin esterase-like enzyme